MQRDIEALAEEAGEIALRHFRALSADAVEAKGHLDLVTAADREVEHFLTERLHALYPDDGIFGEEGAAIEGRSGRLWVIDPIDGTFNFVRGSDQWAISIGLFEDRRPRFGVVHAPARRQMLVGGGEVAPTMNGKRLEPGPSFEPQRGCVGVGLHPAVSPSHQRAVLDFIMARRMVFRCCGSSTISLIELALGHVDGYIGLGEASWDVMACLPILSALGIDNTIDWRTVNLDEKVRYAAGSPAFLALLEPGLLAADS
jgi:myo-inositol-1(or 4)-monophosphatase